MFTPQQLAHQNREILIAATPRTGSNLLVFSLAQHPVAINAGELLCDTQDCLGIVHNTSNVAEGCNLAKIFPAKLRYATAKRMLDSWKLVVYLYRENREAQIRSWRRAERTGFWTAESEQRYKPKHPASIERIIKEAENEFLPKAGLVVSYEEMTSDWDATIEKILAAAQWPIVQLPQALRKMTAADSMR